MKSRARQTLADNINRLVDHHCHGKRRSVRAWALAQGIDPKVAHRALGETGATVETLQMIADALDIEPWHLLYPGLAPGKIPVPPTVSPRTMAIAKALDVIQQEPVRSRTLEVVEKVIELGGSVAGLVAGDPRASRGTGAS